MVDRQDIILTEEFELDEAGDDFTEGDSTETDAMLVIEVQKGEVRHAPWLGFGMRQRLRSVQNVSKFKRELKIELENDGHVNPEVVVTNDDLRDLKIYV